MPLNAIKRCSNKECQAKIKIYRLFDERGLYQEISPVGGKWWRIKYRYNGKEKRLSLGTYPEVSLKEARITRDEFRKLLAEGIDPSAHRKMLKVTSIEKSIYCFEVLAREWLDKYSVSCKSSHVARISRLFKRDLFPWLGKIPVADLTPP